MTEIFKIIGLHNMQLIFTSANTSLILPPIWLISETDMSKLKSDNVFIILFVNIATNLEVIDTMISCWVELS